MNNAYLLDDGIYHPAISVTHREENYDSKGFQLLRKMQEQHFWYRGRHRFLLHSFRKHLGPHSFETNQLKVIDLGGGCGGWVKYLHDRGFRAEELALGDSSVDALREAGRILPESVTRYQIDLLRLAWNDRWTVAFLLDVLEHIPEDALALRQIRDALESCGLLFVTTPAIPFFWTWNDELAHHQRRYTKQDFRSLALQCGFEVVSLRYFMFFLSPLLIASRWLNRTEPAQMTAEDREKLLERSHRVPSYCLNEGLAFVFNCETPIGDWIPFPWGTSILAVLKKV